MRPRVIAVIPAAGYGRRLGMKTKKPLVSIGKKPLISFSLKAFERCKAVNAIIVAAEKSCIKEIAGIAKRLRIRKLLGVVEGGAERSDSVRNCLNTVGRSFDIVLIHDAARPFVDNDTIERTIAAACEFGAAIAAVRESDTVKESAAKLFIGKTLDRNRIYRAQTPQAFRYDLIKRAYRDVGSKAAEFTDDAGLVEAIGARVKIVEGSYKNIKITTKEDLNIAEALLCG